MDINYIALAIPAFLILIGLEFFLVRHHRKELYSIHDVANNIGCGVLEQAFNLPLQGALLFGYYYCYKHGALVHINPHSVYAWVGLWLGVDFLYYWFHRASHRCILLWAGHAVHHQSEYYNFSVALRQGVLQTLFSWIFYLPLALIGFPVWMFLTIASLNTLYQFWIHTQLIGDLGVFEKFFNTPSHHRVHHGKNPEYIDKNYGGSLIIWDKLFGTFVKESVEPQYGTTEPLNSWNVFYANIKVLVDSWYYSGKFASWLMRVFVFLRPPEWIIGWYQQEGLEFQSKPSVKPDHSGNGWVLVGGVGLLIAELLGLYWLVQYGWVLYVGIGGIFLTLWVVGDYAEYGAGMRRLSSKISRIGIRSLES